MSGETEDQVSGWTTDTLKAYVEKQFELRDRATETALAAAERRLDGMNEFRQTLSDQATTFMPRLEAEQRVAQFGVRLSNLETQVTAFISAATGRSSGLADYIAWVVAIAAIATAAVVLLTR